MNQDYYRQYFHLEREHWWFVVRNRIIINHLRGVLPMHRPLNILNVGVATGYSSQLLEEFGKVKSVEYDRECYEFTKANVPIDVMEGTVLELPFSNDTYDLVCAFDVIEHVKEHQLAVDEMQRVCKKEGIVCVTVPAFMFLWNQHDDINHHVRRYTLDVLERLFEKSGEIVFSSYFNFWLFFPIALFRLLSKLIPLHRPKTAEAVSDFTILNGPVFQKVFGRIFKTEDWLIQQRTKFFVGVSALLTWQKAK